MDSYIKQKLTECLNFDIPDEMVDYIMKINNEDQLRNYCETLLDFTNEKHCIFFNALKQKMFPSTHLQQMTINNKPNEEQQQRSTGAKRKTTKYYNLYGKDGKLNDAVMLKGRVKCDCQASKHKLINNCLQCGRIVCEQEGSGACLFCGNFVCSEEELKLINSQTKKGDNLKKSLMNSKGLTDALAHRDRLLEYDKQSERRTTVIDDESDYFKSNSVWLSDEERLKLKNLEDELRSHKHESRRNQKVTLDFAGRQVIEEPKFTKEIEEKILRQILEATSNNNNASNVNPDMMNNAPQFDENIPTNFPKLKNTKGFDGVFSRVQDKEFQEMSDQKSCMSMHQPWASLLVAGIKKHEGRTWYTNHRGRLWIASTVKQADPEEIKHLEDFYRQHYKDENIKFPSQYPSGVLLGCVNVVDCLPQEEYRKIYRNGESDSPFVFICENAQELPVRFPMKGQHKIYKLDQNIHTAACKTLMKCQAKTVPQ
ncbi:hypothetical protein PVAND_012799 [Polypedilum vanderplanki]|uniref:ASCH domain-containing protein n=1 Tax=Polypedilum vanderplanki TaxID=319348 RepID=A0A9J6CNI0_POLVA|nr:hypothetical protein PVAND_012799 [Polypedilum vanderplanki]